MGLIVPARPDQPVAAIVLYALAAPRDPDLEALLGQQRSEALREELALRARRWAALVAAGRAFEATTAGAASIALHDHVGPVLLVAPDIPRFAEDLAPTALADLADGALVVVGPSTDGSPYFVALPSADPQLLELAANPFDGLAGDPGLAGGGVGMLRSERRLACLADAWALHADPLTDPILREHLGPAFA